VSNMISGKFCFEKFAFCRGKEHFLCFFQVNSTLLMFGPTVFSLVGAHFFFLLIVLGAHLGINDGIMPLLTYCHNIDYRVNVLWLRFICNFLFEHCSFIFLCPV